MIVDRLINYRVPILTEVVPLNLARVPLLHCTQPIRQDYPQTPFNRFKAVLNHIEIATAFPGTRVSVDWLADYE
jgi:hypothetical protein